MAWEIRAYLEDGKMVTIYRTEKPLGNIKAEMPKYVNFGFFVETEKPKTLVYYPGKLIKKIEAIEVK
jgi:hypothetical protein